VYSFNTTGTPLPFKLVVVNEGNAMDIDMGDMHDTATGNLFFLIHGIGVYIKDSYSVEFLSYLYLNNNEIGRSYIQENENPVNQFSPLTLQSTLNLKKGDRVWIEISFSGSSSYLFDDSHRHGFHVGRGNCRVILRFRVQYPKCWEM
jgi:hypothetical protein